MGGLRAVHGKRFAAPVAEQCRIAGAQDQRSADQRLLDGAGLPRRGAGGDRFVGIVQGQQVRPRGVVHRAAVIGVDQAEIPQIRALIQVGHARQGAAQQGLRQAVHQAGGCKA
ncbi:hypothetical protein G6F57_021137 [Rhizopus arrhizus]|nr:hypothetical protein G6F57_021137 [Rhizopus arrhizus]